MSEVAPSARPPRIVGYDLARALAIIGMVFVNFRVVLEVQGVDMEGSGFAGWVANWVTGRAAATFVVLAGVGIALLSGRAYADPSQRARTRRRLLQRALFFAVIGWPFLIVWEGDILHYYAAFFAVGALLFHWRPRFQMLGAVALVFGFLLILPIWERNWDFASFTYLDLWTVQGQVLNLLCNGFHPLVPWTAFLMVGMALGRFLQRHPDKTLSIGVLALVFAVAAEFASSFFLDQALDEGMEPSLAKSLFGASSMPPMPQFVVAAGGFAVAAICGCRLIGARLQDHWSLHPILALGRVALTVYIVHVYLGVFPLYLHASGHPEAWNLGRCSALTGVYCLVLMAASTSWLRWRSQGPAEWLMRTFSDGTGRRRWGALAGAGVLMLCLTFITMEEDGIGGMPDEDEFSRRCTRWVLMNPVVGVFQYEDWATENFGSEQEFEDVWLEQAYLDYARVAPLEEEEFREWLTARVRNHLAREE